MHTKFHNTPFQEEMPNKRRKGPQVADHGCRGHKSATGFNEGNVHQETEVLDRTRHS